MDDNKNTIPNQLESLPKEMLNNQESTSIEKDLIVNSQYNNQFINEVNNNDTKLTDLNIDGAYNKLNQDEYAKNKINPQITNIQPKKKATIKVTKEVKVFILIIIIMLAFIIIMPNISDIIDKIRFR